LGAAAAAQPPDSVAGRPPALAGFDALALPEEARFRLVLNDLTVADAFRFLLRDSDLHLVEETPLNMPTSGVLDSVTVPEALEVLTRRHDLCYRVEGRQFLVGRMQTASFPVNQLVTADSPRWEELEQNLRELLDEGGRLVLNKHAGTVTVVDAPSAIRRIEDFLQDVEEDASRQVDLEVKMIEIQLEESMEIGVDWTVFADGWDDVRGNTPSGGLFEQRTVSGAGVFQFGLIHSDRADILVDMLSSQGRLEIISRPRVVTVGNEPALFRAAENVPYFVVDVIPTEGSSPYVQYDIEFREAGVSLEVLTHVGPDEQMTLQVHPSVSEVTGFTPSLPNLPPQPIIDERETRTTVRMRDGETLVIGGLMITREEDDRRGIPFLSKIPILGHLFGRTVTSQEKMELVIILTPRLVRPQTEVGLGSNDRAVFVRPPDLDSGADLRTLLAAHEHNHALEAFHRRDWTEAIRRSRRAVALHPAPGWERLNLALYLARSGNTAAALRELDRCTEPAALLTLADRNRDVLHTNRRVPNVPEVMQLEEQLGTASGEMLETEGTEQP
ncbi:MAG: hypothetical protein GF355_14510, partial [Candidatus Eisenbacteria bacterium]|nr:hypothetical protein [Candidatus Eisenbacteria bacterium]